MGIDSESQASGNPFFFEVPKPINLMTHPELEEFIEVIIQTLEGKHDEILPGL